MIKITCIIFIYFSAIALLFLPPVFGKASFFEWRGLRPRHSKKEGSVHLLTLCASK
jgi:hypothetical protein